ncbi:MAG: DUF2147 domain-containing protein [Cyclobacteriaceae bacterium]
MLKFVFTILITIGFSTEIFSQSVLGQWKTIDDETGDANSVVEITERGGKVYGKILKLFRTADEDQDPICDECPTDDPRYKKKVIGMEILSDMRPDEGEYAGGEILDPKVGKIYKCRIWPEGQQLKVRGYWGPFFRTQTWERYP